MTIIIVVLFVLGVINVCFSLYLYNRLCRVTNAYNASMIGVSRALQYIAEQVELDIRIEHNDVGKDKDQTLN